ncbi:energy transducer TonB [Flavobacterium hydrophilum]|uniref:Energy transducer TonB n=1 Tax=Flavobacterium hydrophilum TaxID=2211445 RepID=A0A2V4BZM4_9FLAO|nr:energy transducer TonB [Flavobacterium hydrophilum]PXY44157.1 energy transducer TonB [Flavobacterium hydrophilum]
MSKLSLYETKWTDLVFENKNKEYGAYQLRQESSKNSITALFTALLIIATLGTASVVINKFRSANTVIAPPTIFDDPIVPVNIDQEIVQPRTEEPIAPPMQESAPATTEVQLTNPVVASTHEATPEIIAPNSHNVPTSDNTSDGTGTAVNALPTSGGSGTGEGTGSGVDSGTGSTIVNSAILDKMPEFPGGMSKFYTYVGNNFNRPELDTEKTLKVYVSFVIEKDGSMTDITVKNDPGYGLGKEAIRVLKSLKTKWTPGILDGKAVRTAYNLPITIKTEME